MRRVDSMAPPWSMGPLSRGPNLQEALLPGLSSRISGAICDLVANRYLGKPDQAELIRIKFPDLASLAYGAMNEFAFRLRLPVSARLTTLNVEITNRCNLRCGYCPVNRSMARPKTDLSFEAYCDILRRSPSVRTLLPFQWGEPMLHPRVVDMVAFATTRGIRTYLTTNGTRLDASTNRALLRAGPERITISVDGPDEVHLATRGVELAPIREQVSALRRLRDELGARTRIDVSMVVDAQTAAGIAEMKRAWGPVVDRVQAIPRMVSGARARACREPWRGLLVVLADGRTTTCCADSEGQLSFGDALLEPPAKLFNGCTARALRRAHARGDLPAPCDQCEEYGHPETSKRFQ